MKKLKRAAKETGIKHIAIGGGVSANTGIRNALQVLGAQYGWHTYIPKFQYCTDNAAMIGIVGYYKYLQEQFVGQEVTAQARLSLGR